MRHLSRNSRASILSLACMMISAAGTASAENPSGTSAPRQPVNYLVKEKSLVGNEMHEAGAIVAYAGLPAENLEPTCDIGRARYQEYLESNKERVEKMIRDNKESDHGVGDPKAFMAALVKQREEDRKELADQSARQAEAIGTAVANAMASAFAAFFPNGIPTAAPAAPVELAKVEAKVEQEASTKPDHQSATDSTADPAAPPKRTKG